jgi:3',5'-cyclic-AMP phosphodiesterase
MAQPFMFAHITDVHMTEPPRDEWQAIGLDGQRLLRETFEHLNTIDELDFVLITGDVLNLATPGELEDYLEVLQILEKPWHFVPGNHDGYIHESNPLALQPDEAASAIDPRLAEYNADSNCAFWSREVLPGIQIIGLDSRIVNDWAGEIRPQQLDWLRRELDRCSYQDLVIVAVHHPVHKLGPHNEREWWNKFVLSNGRPVERLFDIYSNVQLVISGHHHCNHITIRNHRMHLVTAALTGFPCSYRTIRMKPTPDGWHARIETHVAADQITLNEAEELLLASPTARQFDAINPTAWLAFCAGTEKDLEFDDVIEGNMHAY